MQIEYQLIKINGEKLFKLFERKINMKYQIGIIRALLFLGLVTIGCSTPAKKPNEISIVPVVSQPTHTLAMNKPDLGASSSGMSRLVFCHRS